MKQPKMTVLVATYARDKELRDVLKQILAEDYPDYEVLVVDQSERHDADTEAYLEDVKDRIRLVHLTTPSLTGAWNVGILVAKGDVVLFLDDDIEFEPGLIAAHAANYEDDTLSGVAGMVTHDIMPPTRQLPGICTSTKAGWFFFEHNYNRRIGVRVAPGGNMSWRRDVLLQVGGMDESLIANAIHAEIDLCYRVRNIGGHVVHDPKARMHHLRAPRGGVRMGGVRPRSYFANYLRVVWRCVNRHERGVILWRMLRNQVLIRSKCRPITTLKNLWNMTVELVNVIRHGPAERKLGSWMKTNGIIETTE